MTGLAAFRYDQNTVRLGIRMAGRADLSMEGYRERGNEIGLG